MWACLRTVYQKMSQNTEWRPMPATFLQTMLTHIAHLCGNCRVVWIKNLLIGYFIKRYKPNMDDAREVNPFAYGCFLDFFTRKLRDDARPIDVAKQSMISPADGQVSQVGYIEHGEIFQAKGLTYSLTELLADRPWAKDFEGGAFSTIYLAPIDYHRVHMPISGVLKEMVYIPGQLFSVKSASIDQVPGLFARNERVVCLFKTEIGPVVVAMIAATLVSGIELSWAGLVNPKRGGELSVTQYDQSYISLEKGDELGCFHFGSTVIVLAPKKTVEWKIQADQHIAFGQKVAHLVSGVGHG